MGMLKLALLFWVGVLVCVVEGFLADGYPAGAWYGAAVWLGVSMLVLIVRERGSE